MYHYVVLQCWDRTLCMLSKYYQLNYIPRPPNTPVTSVMVKIKWHNSQGAAVGSGPQEAADPRQISQSHKEPWWMRDKAG